MKLVPDARRSWRWFSMQAMTLSASAQMIWTQLPADTKAAVPQEWIAYGTVAVLALGIIGRVVDQA